jgi:hypothetical protein
MNEFRNTSGEVVRYGAAKWETTPDGARYLTPDNDTVFRLEREEDVSNAKPKRSRGEEIAEKLVSYDTAWIIFGDRDCAVSNSVPCVSTLRIRRVVATAIDAAIAEERERCAKAVEAWPQIMDGRFVLSTRIRSPE